MANKNKSRRGDNIKGEASGSQTVGGGAIQDLGGVHRVVTGSGPAEGQSGIQPAGSQSVQTDPNAPPQGYETWAAFREAVDKGTYKPQPATTGQQQAQPGQETPKDQQQPPAQGLPTVTDPAMQAKMAPFTEEYSKTGTLSAASKEKAAKEFGVTTDMVDLYLAGATANATAREQPFLTEFGGQESYTQFSEWAAQNLSDQEKAAYNSALDKAPEAALALAKGFKTRWQAEGNGPAARDITRSSSTSQPGGDQYGSWEEVKQDMGNPKYERDPAFRAKVEAKLGRSNPKS